jgi:hypothetical protein
MEKEPFGSTTGEGGEDVALTKVKNVNFPAMKKWIEDFFDVELLVSCDILSNPYTDRSYHCKIILLLFSL